MSAVKDWLTVNYRTRFRFDGIGRIERENDPDGLPGPLAWLGGCADGNVFGIGAARTISHRD